MWGELKWHKMFWHKEAARCLGEQTIQCGLLMGEIGILFFVFFNIMLKMQWNKLFHYLTVLHFCVHFAFSPPLPFVQREDGRGSNAADDESPLWTVSFPAECVQWARARSWNLANETHPPKGLSSFYWLKGGQRRRWLADGAQSGLLSEQVANQTRRTHSRHCSPWRG